MSNEQYSFIIVKYAGKDTAGQALATVWELAREKVVKLKDAVAITKTDKGKLKLHHNRDDPVGKGFLKGGLIGLILAVLFGGAAWMVAGMALGATFGLFVQGVRDKLLKELGENMTPDESALAVLIEEADWGTLLSRMDAKYSGEAVVEQLVEDHLAAVEALTEQPETIKAVPEELELAESAK